MKKKLMLIVVLFFSLIASAAIIVTKDIFFRCPICWTVYEIDDVIYNDTTDIYKYICKACGLEKIMNQEEFDEAVRKLEKTLADQNKSEASVE